MKFFQNHPKDISSFTLHLLAMVFMLCDHLWATVIPGNQWLTNIGRLAFPIFAFFLVEGYFYTKNIKKYWLRLLVFALLSEIPMNLMDASSLIYPFHQNVLWTFLLSLLCIRLLDKLRSPFRFWLSIPLGALAVLGFVVISIFTFVDYSYYGLLTVVMFYLFRGG